MAISKAIDLLKQQGLAKAEKKSGRAASQGLIEPYIHGAGRIGSIVEVNCETDFVARTPDFRELAHDLAMQVAATSPRYVSVEEMPAMPGPTWSGNTGAATRQRPRLSCSSSHSSRIRKLTIRDLVRERIAKLGENIVVSRFARFEVGAEDAAPATNAAIASTGRSDGRIAVSQLTWEACGERAVPSGPPETQRRGDGR